MTKKTLWWSLFAVVCLGAILCIAMCVDVQTRYLDRILDRSEEASTRASDVIMVLGASVKSDGTPSDALRDRLLTGLELYQDGKAPNILLTGDDGDFHADEIDVMRNFLITQGVPTSTIRIDGKGYRTYESCKDVKAEGITTALIVTQRFHLARALYLCNSLGVDSYGIISDRQSYEKIAYFWVRDLLASVKAWWDINIWTPKSPAE